MQNILLVNKPLGLTPLQAIQAVKALRPQLAKEKISVAGRLDPMAEGLLLLLIGEENKQRKTYEALPKTYEFSVLFGVSSDTYDLLGKITHSASQQQMENGTWIRENLQDMLPNFIGKQMQPYPPYSSRTVQGKPLYWWARKNKLHEIIIPEKAITITSLSLSKSETLPSSLLHKTIIDRISKVHGDFRQAEILNTWNDYFSHAPLPHFPLFHFSITCSSGTYVRALANKLGREIQIPALAYSIKRTAIGDFKLKNTSILSL